MFHNVRSRSFRFHRTIVQRPIHSNVCNSTQPSISFKNIVPSLPVADPGFSWGGANCQCVCANLLFCNFFLAENCMKMKEFGPWTGRVLAPLMDPPMITFNWTLRSDSEEMNLNSFDAGFELRISIEFIFFISPVVICLPVLYYFLHFAKINEEKECKLVRMKM